MEPFGLFQFLQNLLASTPPSQKETEETLSHEEGELPSQKTENPVSVNAAASFLEEHERRARRRK